MRRRSASTRRRSSGAKSSSASRSAAAAAIAAIGEVSGREGEERDREKDRERGVAERQRIAGDVVEIPADRHRLHLHREAGEEPSAEKKAEIAKGER